MALDKVFDGEGHIFGTELSQYALETAVNRIGRDLLNKRFTLIRVKDLFNLQQFNILFLGRLEYTIICPFLQIGSMEFFMLMCVLVGPNYIWVEQFTNNGVMRILIINHFSI
jgi:hypothetical protein